MHPTSYSHYPCLSIIEKLVALGWGDEIDKIPACDALTNHKLVKAPQLLTERSKLDQVWGLSSF
jgi:hypothetical protein